MISIERIVTRAWPSSPFVRNVTVLAGGTASTQVMGILAAPLLTRLYTPEDFGVLAVFSGLLSVLAVVAGLRYEQAIVLPETQDKATHVAAVGLIMVLLLSLASILAIFLWGENLATYLNSKTLGRMIWLLPVAVFSLGTFQVFQSSCIREKCFSSVVKTKFVQVFCMLSVQLIGFRMKAGALIAGLVAGHIVGSALLARYSMNTGMFRRIRVMELRNAAVRYKRFPLIDTWSGLLNTASTQLPPVLFAMLFSPAIAGVYALTFRVLAMPMTLIGSSVANVFLSQAAERYRQGNLGDLVERVHLRLAHIAMPIVLILVTSGPQLFVLVFGEDWGMGGEFARWMSPWIYFVLVASPLSVVYSVMEKQAQGVVFQAFLFSARVLSIAIGAGLGSIMIAVAMFSVSSALCWLGSLLWILFTSGCNLKNILSSTATILAVNFLLVLPLVLSTMFTMSLHWWFASLLLSVVAIGIHQVRVFRT